MWAIHLKTSTKTTRISTTSAPKRKSRRYQQRRLKRTRKKLNAAQALAITIEEKNFIQRSEQAATAVRDKLKQQFGFVADPNKSLLHNASTTLTHTPTWYYFSRPSHLAFHDFTQNKQPAKNIRSLLGLGLKFIPTPRYTNTWKKLRELSMPKFTRAIHLRFHFAGTSTTQDDTYDPKLYVKSNWTPPHWTLPPVVMTKRLENFSNTLDKLFKKRIGKTNLLPYETRALQLLQQQQDFLVCRCDKNLGPVIIERDDYIKIAIKDQLLDGRTYRRLSLADCENNKTRIEEELKSWMKKFNKTLTKMERAFLKQGLENNKKAFAGFYLTLKAHKLKPGQNVTHLKSRPIVACPGSLLHPLGIWIDRKLQVIAKQQDSYFRNSFELRQQLCSTTYPTNAKLFTADAVSMYTNIPTNTAIMLIAKHIRKSVTEERPKQNDALIAALKLVMLNNIFCFGDMTFKQLNGTAMGTPPAPPYATIYYGIHEKNFLPKHNKHVIFYKRFIDDVFGIWTPHPNPQTDAQLWDEFKHSMNAFPGLTWEFEDPSDKVNFMDLTITIKKGHVSTSLFEKPLNLHLYIPPHSAHPPGLLPGIVHSTLFRIFTLCSDHDDRVLRTRVFFKRLQARGYKSDQIKPLFYKAISRAERYSGPTNSTRNDHTSVIFHLPFHPNDPPSYKIQQAWRDNIASPRYHMPLPNMRNPKAREKCNIERMIIAYRRPMNIGNILSHRNLNINPTAPPVSSYYPYD